MKRLVDGELARSASGKPVSADDKIIVQRRPNDLARLLISIRRGEAGSEAAREFFDRKTPQADP
jgi:hypothetical protein